MPITNPGSISNSSSKQFSNVYGRIAIDNYNIILGSISSYDYYATINNMFPIPRNKYPNIKPKSVCQVIKSTKLI
jgi:hypothetical protein